MNVPKASLDNVLKILPAEQSPTVNALADENWVAVEVVLDERVERDMAPRSSVPAPPRSSATPLNKVIP